MHHAKVTHHKKLTHDIFELTFETKDIFKFKSGQFITIKINDKQEKPCFRAYSIASPPDKNIFKLIIKVIPDGRGSNWLHSIKTGDKIEFIGPSGDLALKTPPQKTALFIATGTGVAPFKSMLEDEFKKEITQKFHLIWGLRHEKDIFYNDFFKELAQKHENFTLDLTLSRPENADWQGKTGRVTALLEKLLSSDGRACPSIDSIKKPYEIYICGIKEMVEDVVKILEEKGIQKSKIYTERYD